MQSLCRLLKGKGGKDGSYATHSSHRQPTDPNRYRDLECIVDSGATFTVVPKKILEELDIKPRSSRTFVLANGEKFERSLGNAVVEYKGARGGASVIFGEEGDFSLLGVTSLEALGLIFDALRQDLKPALMLMANAGWKRPRRFRVP